MTWTQRASIPAQHRHLAAMVSTSTDLHFSVLTKNCFKMLLIVFLQVAQIKTQLLFFLICIVMQVNTPSNLLVKLINIKKLTSKYLLALIILFSPLLATSTGMSSNSFHSFVSSVFYYNTSKHNATTHGELFGQMENLVEAIYILNLGSGIRQKRLKMPLNLLV